MEVIRDHHTATILTNGNVLVTGGSHNGATQNSTELYDSSTEIWITTGSMNNARQNHQAVLLKDGKVLVTGGSNVGKALHTAELYDPSTELWTTVDKMNNIQGGLEISPLTNG
ncbi:unnamed protein product [Adineta steineri]|nr:unnamed protein product [Adineta steineri]